MFTQCEYSQGVLNSVEEVVDAVGGPEAAAALARVEYLSTVSNWKTRGKIPPEYFMSFSAALERAGKAVNPSVFGFVPEDGVTQ